MKNINIEVVDNGFIVAVNKDGVWTRYIAETKEKLHELLDKVLG